MAPLLETIRHRGPDGEGHYTDPGGRLQLGFRRLAIIDLNTGNQPIFNEDGTVVVVLNGEIYNYIELTEMLRKKSHRFRSQGDAEVIVHLYEEYGEDCLRYLEGMFAIALWDERTGYLLLARDPLGIKPLYYATNGKEVAFASEIKPLLRLSWVSREVDQIGLVQYLANEYVLAPHTFFKSIRKLPAAHKVTVTDGVFKESSYWDCQAPKRIQGSVEEIAAQLLEAFDRSVRLHLRSDVPVGAFLSGGLDSSLLVARAARLHPRLRTYTLRFEGRSWDESPLAAQVAERYETEHRT
ncbi:MAG: asparagine synthase (glutamine-hydrolyzing), partial [Sideroxydans sp.]|nr:asparagine synthase (glutamine-hydrolyzing) [Sideroxydans sp.]